MLHRPLFDRCRISSGSMFFSSAIALPVSVNTLIRSKLKQASNTIRDKDMTTSYQALEQYFQRLAQLEHALTFLQWDQLVMMPPGGNESRSAAIAELSTMHHEMLVKKEVCDMLDQVSGVALSAGQQTSLGEMKRLWKRASCLPSDLVKAKSLAGSKCEHAWRIQKKENDWPGFLRNFKEVVNLSRQEAQARLSADSGHFATPYDALLDLYCTGDSSLLIDTVFTRLKKELPPLLEQVVERQKGHAVEMSGSYPVERQHELSRKLMTVLGFDLQKGRLDESSHPFSTGCRGDHRITTRFRSEDFIDALKATAHETGHASYEDGLPARWHGLPVGQARNLSIHESQSLLFEKQIFLSRPFISFFTPTIHEYLPETASFNSSLIWRACTKVEPSYIRVEADEISYPLHVILRFEIEKDLMNNDLEPEDIPAAWDEKMQRYLGLSTVGDHRRGCLQDIHWTDGSFGYFPAYTLGSLNGAQLFETICKAHPDWQDRFLRGDIAFVREWLDAHIWSKGSTMESQQIINSATGEGTNPDHFLTSIRARYLDEPLA